MTERDSVLMKYAKASGAFEYAVHKFNKNKTEQNLQEAQCKINDLINRELPAVKEYCQQHLGEEGIDSLLFIADTDCKTMQNVFQHLKF